MWGEEQADSSVCSWVRDYTCSCSDVLHGLVDKKLLAGCYLFVCRPLCKKELFGPRRGIHLHVFDAVRVFHMLGWRQLCEAILRRSNISWHIILGWKMISQLGSQWCRLHDTEAHTVCIPALSVWPHEHTTNVVVVNGEIIYRLGVCLVCQRIMETEWSKKNLHSSESALPTLSIIL